MELLAPESNPASSDLLDLPPSYREATIASSSPSSPRPGDPQALLDPLTLHLIGQWVYPTTLFAPVPPNGPGAPAYSLSQQVNLLHDEARAVNLSRHEHEHEHEHSSERERLIYRLTHPSDALGYAFPFVAEVAAPRSAGHVGLEPRRRWKRWLAEKGGGRAYSAWRIVPDGKGDWKKKAFKFEVRAVKDGSYEYWKVSDSVDQEAKEAEGDERDKADECGVCVARETKLTPEVKTLDVLVSMDQPTRDMLVACWCMRMWEQLSRIHK